MQLIIGLVVAAGVFLALRLFGSSSSRRPTLPPNIVYARGSSGATAPPGGAPSPVPPGGGYVTTPAGEAFITESYSQQEVENLAQYGTSWGKGQPPPTYTAGNLFGPGSTLAGSGGTVASSGTRSFTSRGGVV